MRVARDKLHQADQVLGKHQPPSSDA
jgi:hypothetical protein